MSKHEYLPVAASAGEIAFVHRNEAINIYVDPNGKDYSGLRRVAGSLAEDIGLVTGIKPDVVTVSSEIKRTAIIAGSVGNNSLIDDWIAQGRIDAASLQNKREVYQIQVLEQPLAHIDQAIVVIGSDKRGTMYGLYYISQLIGVSPWVYWGDVPPAKQQELTIPVRQLNIVSKQPSIKYRGFFINDEWPSFGSWTNHAFGGFNEEMYEKVFQLLLRLKGNYMWPAMWSAVFSEDGTNASIANAKLADEYGIVMATSHHEPMFRSGEEWSHIHQRYSSSGEWDFRSNRKAITKFWEDGVIRNKDFESFITLGMRGERDSELGGGIAENIQLLKDIITTQKQLLQKYGLQDAPKSLVIYKEVERFWHGTDSVPGLKSWDELDDVTIMLSDDNFGNTRTLPIEQDRFRKAGWGLYYHFDYHGGPVSYEWVNTVQLEKVWEQMSMAYDYGIRDIWVVNVGDLKPMELPLSYFMELAYDFETYGTNGINKTSQYLHDWARQQFGHAVDEEAVAGITRLLADYTKLNGARKPEVTYTDTYSCTAYHEAQRVLEQSLRIEAEAAQLRGLIPESHQDAYYQFVYYPAVASANVKKMNICAGLNHKYNAFPYKSALINEYAKRVKETIEADERMQDEYNNVLSGGKWKGMMSSPHIGYTNWNADGWAYPEAGTVPLQEEAFLIVDVEGTNQAFISGSASLPVFTNLGKESYSVTISNGGQKPFEYRIETDAAWIKIDSREGTVQTATTVKVTVDWDQLSENESGNITIEATGQRVIVQVAADIIDVCELPEMTFVETHDVVSIEAEHYSNSVPSGSAGWKVIDHYGRTLSALKMYPTTVSFQHPIEAPYLEYTVYTSEEREYTLTVYAAPSNYLSADSRLRYAVAFDREQPMMNDLLTPDHEPGYSKSWEAAVMNNIHTAATKHQLSKGLHTLRFYGLDAGLVLQKLVLAKGELPFSYFGPQESFYVAGRETK